MQKKLKQLLLILADNQFHSGEEIGKQLGVTRASVWKLMQYLQEIGFAIEGISRRGYKLKHSIAFLCKKSIKQHLTKSLQKTIKVIDVFDEIDSTNTYLLQQMHNYMLVPRVCVAETQTYGRGRYGRHWHSPYAQNIYLSILWRLKENYTEIHALPLVICLAIVNALEQYNLPCSLQVKWPNNVYYQNRKLAGVLIETLTEVNNNSQIVIGIGLNTNMTYAAMKEIDQSWISLLEILSSVTDRNMLTARLLASCTHYLDLFSQYGFKIFQKEWQRYDIFHGKLLHCHCHQQTFTGIASGVDKNGMLCIASKKNKKMYFSIGEIEEPSKHTIKA